MHEKEKNRIKKIAKGTSKNAKKATILMAFTDIEHYEAFGPVFVISLQIHIACCCSPFMHQTLKKL